MREIHGVSPPNREHPDVRVVELGPEWGVRLTVAPNHYTVLTAAECRYLARALNRCAKRLETGEVE